MDSCVALIQKIMKWSLHNFAHDTTVELSWHVQTFVVIWQPGMAFWVKKCQYNRHHSQTILPLTLQIIDSVDHGNNHSYRWLTPWITNGSSLKFQVQIKVFFSPKRSTTEVDGKYNLTQSGAVTTRFTMVWYSIHHCTDTGLNYLN